MKVSDDLGSRGCEESGRVSFTDHHAGMVAALPFPVVVLLNIPVAVAVRGVVVVVFVVVVVVVVAAAVVVVVVVVVVT